MATASVSCASVEIEPSDIAPVAKRLTISLAGSTSSSGTGSLVGAEAEQAAQRGAARRVLVDLARVLVVLLLRVAHRPHRSPLPLPLLLTACCSSEIVSGFHMWCSPSRRQA